MECLCLSVFKYFLTYVLFPFVITYRTPHTELMEHFPLELTPLASKFWFSKRAPERMNENAHRNSVLLHMACYTSSEKRSEEK